MELKLTFDLLPVIGVVLTILAWYLPGFKTWYEKLLAEQKQAFMAGILFLTAAVVSVLSVLGLLHVYPVDQGWVGLIWYPFVDFVIAIVANAGVYKAGNYIANPKKQPSG